MSENPLICYWCNKSIIDNGYEEKNSDRWFCSFKCVQSWINYYKARQDFIWRKLK